MQERAATESKGDAISSTAFDQTDEPHAANRHQDLANLAYQLWEQRGRPYGSPEQDWYEAEHRVSLESESPESVKPVR